jgi:hypothetical protein
LQQLQLQVKEAEHELNMLHSQMKQRGLQIPTPQSSNGFSLNTGQVQGVQSQADVEQVKRQLDEL